MKLIPGDISILQVYFPVFSGNTFSICRTDGVTSLALGSKSLPLKYQTNRV